MHRTAAASGAYTEEVQVFGDGPQSGGELYGDLSMEDQSNRNMLLTRMDAAFTVYSTEAENLSVLLAEPRDVSSWSSYHNLLKQRTAEAVAYEKYRGIKDQLFALISPPGELDRPESNVN
jgi:hypothetical protein